MVKKTSRGNMVKVDTHQELYIWLEGLVWIVLCIAKALKDSSGRVVRLNKYPPFFG